MMKVSGYLAGLLFGGSPYRWESMRFNQSNMVRMSGRLKGRKKSIYHKWGFDDDAYHIHLSKAESKGKSWQETQKMRMDIFKMRNKKHVQ